MVSMCHKTNWAFGLLGVPSALAPGSPTGECNQKDWWFNHRKLGYDDIPSGKLTYVWKITLFNR